MKELKEILTNKSTVWDFVEKYYPNYSHCNEIAENSDLQCIVDGEVEEWSQAAKLYEYIKEYLKRDGGNASHKDIMNEVENRLYESNSYIYEKAIEAYLLTL